MKTIIIDGVEYNLTPKVVFHEGDWVVYDHRVYQVVELPKEGCINLCLRGNGKIEFAPSTYCRHWTIQDAKAGDMLYDGSNACIFRKKMEDDEGTWVDTYCGINLSGTFIVEDEDEYWCLACECVPATKEQRDLLFQKMKEVGYEWDANTKKLKKIEQNPTWSEEDDKNLLEISCLIGNYRNGDDEYKLDSWLNHLKDRVQPKQEWSDGDEEHIKSILQRLEGMCQNGATFTRTRFAVSEDKAWLESLRPQSHWKPSDKQMKAIEHICDGDYKVDLDILDSIYRDFKKLKD